MPEEWEVQVSNCLDALSFPLLKRMVHLARPLREVYVPHIRIYCVVDLNAFPRHQICLPIPESSRWHPSEECLIEDLGRPASSLPPSEFVSRLVVVLLQHPCLLAQFGNPTCADVSTTHASLPPPHFLTCHHVKATTNTHIHLIHANNSKHQIRRMNNQIRMRT